MDSLSENLQENFDRFIVECLETGCIWGLRGKNDDLALVASTGNENIDVIPFWSAQKLAQDACEGQWDLYKPTPIELEEFLDDWLPGMHNDLLLVGVNWSADLQGEEMEPSDLLEEFEEELD